jgi:hypothetical protein
MRSLSPEALLALQRVIGNTAVGQALRRYRDEHEREHDAARDHEATAQRYAVHDVLRTSGRPLEEPVQAEMEQRLGADFSNVRVHTDSAAHASAQEMNAHAYTSGSHIVFQRGRYDGSSAAGKKLLAHELTHVMQQRQGPVSGTSVGDGLAVSDPRDSFERAAEAGAEHAMARPLQRTPDAATPTAGPAPVPGGPALSAGPGLGGAGEQPVQRTTIGNQIEAYVTRNLSSITNLSTTLRTTPVYLVDALLDPAFDLENAYQLSREILEENVRDPLTFASCFPTAQALFQVMTEATEQGAEGANLNSYPDGDAFRAQVEGLIGAMEQAVGANANAIFRIEFGGHGFSLILRSPTPGTLHFELIESLAHTASLDRSLSLPGFTPVAIYNNLRNMSSDDVNTRRGGANGMGWNADALYLGAPPIDGGEQFPQTRMKWWAKTLSSEWAVRWTNQLTHRFNFLAERYSLADRLS